MSENRPPGGTVGGEEWGPPRAPDRAPPATPTRTRWLWTAVFAVGLGVGLIIDTAGLPWMVVTPLVLVGMTVFWLALR